MTFTPATDLRAALVHGRDRFDAFLLHPHAQLEDADHRRLVLFGNLDRVANVVAVAVRANQRVGLLHVLLALRT